MRALRLLPLLLALGVLVVPVEVIEAQCVMCKAVAEDSAAEGAVGRGINQGILYIMAVPYILLGTIGYLIFKVEIRRIMRKLYACSTSLLPASVGKTSA